MEQAVDALMGAAYGSAGERCMAIPWRCRSAKGPADTLMSASEPEFAH